MRITNAKIFTGGMFLNGGVEYGDTIRDVGAELRGGLDAEGCLLIPGLVDIHTHAAAGADASDEDLDGLFRLARWYAAHGVTSWCPTTMTLSETELTRAMRVLGSYARPADGARLLGVNLEGPFVSREKCGAQNTAYLHAPDAALFDRLNAASGGLVRLVTVAPELPGATEFIRHASGVCTVALGHTAADYETAERAFAAGARHVTHLFNAMPPLRHREPGLIAAALDAGATAELIADGLHVHPAVVRLAVRLFGDDLAIISDSIRCAGMPNGTYMLGGQLVMLRDGRATLRDTDTLAGGVIDLMEALHRAISFGIPPERAITAVTATPARIAGRADVGAIEPGRYADFVLLDAELKLRAVFVNGRQIAGAALHRR